MILCWPLIGECVGILSHWEWKPQTHRVWKYTCVCKIDTGVTTTEERGEVGAKDANLWVSKDG